ncbi:Ran GTPase-binding protein LOS1 [Sporobolomyces salmoneus]|uniref:Ran GTPase-binding protein LOS1 n=1 Tax=Sporobolomyces salmoneus TaxID=183962 RepID=UPI003177B4FD
MDQLSSQITQAISFALNPDPSIPQTSRHEAYGFLQQVKNASRETWQTCWTIFLDGRTTEQGQGGGQGSLGKEERMFALQVVAEALPSLSPEALAMLQSSMFDYFQREYISGPAENGVAFLKNASVNLAAQVFVHTYPSIAPNFLSSFLALLRTYPSSSSASTSSPPPLNPQTTDLLLRLLHEISLEIGDAQLRLNKPAARLAKDGELRDAIRQRDAVAIAGAVWEIIAEAVEGVEKQEEGDSKIGLKGKTARDVGEMAVRVAGDYVSWIDINLMVTPPTISLLLRTLNLPHPSCLPIRIATADTLIETVMKGMPAGDKLKLFQVLDVATVLSALKDVGREGGRTDAASDEEEGFRERLAKLLNGVGTELCKMLDESSTPDDAKALATVSLTPLLPLLISFLSDSHAATSLTLHPFASQLLSIYKKQKRAAGAGQVMTDPTMTSEKRGFLEQLLKAAVGKMEFGQEVEWEMSIVGEEDEDQLLFEELRKSLRTIGDGIAWIDPELYGTAIRTIVSETLDAYEASPTSVPWQRIELALALLYGFGQAIAGSGPGAFVLVPTEELTRAKREANYSVNFNQFPLSPLGELMLRACRSKVAAHDHPAVNLMFFETIVRYSEFFKLCPEYIAELLPTFLDQHGLHQSDSAVRARVCYLFSRFIYQARTIIQSQVSGDLIRGILSGMQDLLVINADLPDSEPPSEALLTKTASSPGLFESQLYLFETVGTLISILNQVPPEQVVLLNAVLDPLLSQLEGSVRPTANSPEDFKAILTSHHLIMALGNVAKGFPDLSARQPTAQGQWVQGFRKATEGVLASAKIMASFVVVRDAARFAFNRIVATTGQAVLDLIPTLIDCLIGQITFPELAELLSFLGLLVAKYKTNFTTILDTLLLPVFNRVFEFLQLPIAGTDDRVQHSTLKRAYFNFIITICSANLQQVFYSEKNQPHLQSILQSITHYISTNSLAPDQRYGFGVLVKLVSIWVDPNPLPPPNPKTGPVVPSPVPGFERFIYENVIGICFEIPLKREFDYADAQSYTVIGEIALLLKTVHQKRPQEFESFLETSFFPSINCPPEKAQPFMVALREAPDGKQLKKFLSEWLRNSRGY